MLVAQSLYGAAALNKLTVVGTSKAVGDSPEKLLSRVPSKKKLKRPLSHDGLLHKLSPTSGGVAHPVVVRSSGTDHPFEEVEGSSARAAGGAGVSVAHARDGSKRGSSGSVSAWDVGRPAAHSLLEGDDVGLTAGVFGGDSEDFFDERAEASASTLHSTSTLTTAAREIVSPTSLSRGKSGMFPSASMGRLARTESSVSMSGSKAAMALDAAVHSMRDLLTAYLRKQMSDSMEFVSTGPYAALPSAYRYDVKKTFAQRYALFEELRTIYDRVLISREYSRVINKDLRKLFFEAFTHLQSVLETMTQKYVNPSVESAAADDEELFELDGIVKINTILEQLSRFIATRGMDNKVNKHLNDATGGLEKLWRSNEKRFRTEWAEYGKARKKSRAVTREALPFLNKLLSEIK